MTMVQVMASDAATKANVVLTRLLRSGEESVLAWPVEMRWQADAQASWGDFVETRFALWQAVVDSGEVDHLPIGWADAAVRIYGGDALVALWDVRSSEWPGRGAAEEQLLAMNGGVVRERVAWGRD